jgi:hypothetical protein
MPIASDTLTRFANAISEQIAWRNGHRTRGQRIAVEAVSGALLVQNGRCVLLVAPLHEIASIDSDANLHKGVNARLQAAIREMEDMIPEEGVGNSEYLISQCIPVAIGEDLEPIQSGGPA